MIPPPDSNQLPTRFWRARYHGKKLWHNLCRWLRSLAGHWFFKLILPWVTGSYYAMLDIWGDKWHWIKDDRETHELIFCVCLGLSLVSQFISGITREPENLESDKMAREVIGEFIENVGAIVQAKIDRFRIKLGEIRPGSDKFKHITKPEDQIAVIALAAARFLKFAYGLKEDQIDITIMKRKGEGQWDYHFKLQQWSHGSPDELMKRGATALQCINRREPAFYPDKIKAAFDGEFVLSDRDKRRKEGSVYVYPILFSGNVKTVECVISIVTYGRQFCPDYDKTSRDATEAFLREICRRFELELCLDTIRGI